MGALRSRRRAARRRSGAPRAPAVPAALQSGGATRAAPRRSARPCCRSRASCWAPATRSDRRRAAAARHRRRSRARAARRGAASAHSSQAVRAQQMHAGTRAMRRARRSASRDLRADWRATAWPARRSSRAFGCVAAACARALGVDALRHPAASPPRRCSTTSSPRWRPAKARRWPPRCAAAVAALAGIPVHVVTANDYLAARDARDAGAAVRGAGSARRRRRARARVRDARRAAYACDIVYCTAQELAFDYLRDRAIRADRAASCSALGALAGQRAPAPLLRGLCMAILDEADSILLDEATCR